MGKSNIFLLFFVHSGFGTLEELLEMTTWSLLGIHQKPIGLLNVNHYYDSLISQVDRGIEEGFIQARFRDILIVRSNIDEILHAFAHYQPITSLKPIKG
jgi:uncharacterized protein (TIGR00730 family)